MKKTKEEIMRETERLLVDDAAIIKVYEEVLCGKLKQFPAYTWEMPNSLYYAKVLTRYLLEVKLQWSMDDIRKNIRGKVFANHKLRGMNEILFKSMFSLIDNAYPNTFRPWEFRHAPKNFWNSYENRYNALHWLFEEKLEGNLEYIKNTLSNYTFKEHGLFGLLLIHFEGSPFQALDFMYPSQVKPWELKITPNKIWECDENKKEALIWLFEERLNRNIKQFNRNSFETNNLSNLLRKYFQNNPQKALSFAYPDLFKLSS